MSGSSRRNFLLGLIIPLTLSAACAKEAPSEQAAKKFMDAYYVRINLQDAEKLSSGLAQERLTHQISLLDGTKINANTNVPTVDFKLVSQDPPNADEASYVFEVIPHVQDIGHRKVYVKLRQDNGAWKVSQFTEEVQNPPTAPQ